ncbi:hypothetical protein Mgra_00007914 [Meloidogyne graminicola]|nr:hypothetical protein Mgra_00007914 [Meloidogyne graminicola]
MGTHHGVKFATHPDMFIYFPLDPSLTIGTKIGDDTNDIEMMEANMIIIRKSNYTKQLLKWSLLCAFTPECIEPIGAKLSCQDYYNDHLFEDGRCHREDQSLMNILLHNMELKLIREGFKITPHLRYNHPSKWGNRHSLKRKQKTNANIIQLYGKNINGKC